MRALQLLYILFLIPVDAFVTSRLLVPSCISRQPRPATTAPLLFDSIQAFEADCTKIMKELQTSSSDPDIPPWFDPQMKLSFSNYWSLEEWEKHYSRGRYLRYLLRFPKSRLLRRLWPQLLFTFLWTIIAIRCSELFVEKFQVPLASLSLVSTFVAALQTLRSNQGLERLKEARIAMGRMILHTRDLSQLVSTYISPKDTDLGLRIGRHLSLFGFILKSHYRETASDELLDTMLSPVDAAFIKSQRRRPVAIVARLRQLIQHASEAKILTSTSEHSLHEFNLQHLNEVIAIGERIRGTPIPPVYSAHSTRLMVVFLLWLPFALIGSLSSVAIVAVTMVIAFAMMGLDEMSHMFEQPFRFMPLYHLSKLSCLDVADAFCRPPPSIHETSLTSLQKPTYWASAGMERKLPYDGSNFSEDMVDNGGQKLLR